MSVKILNIDDILKEYGDKKDIFIALFTPSPYSERYPYSDVKPHLIHLELDNAMISSTNRIIIVDVNGKKSKPLHSIYKYIVSENYDDIFKYYTEKLNVWKKGREKYLNDEISFLNEY